MTTIRTELDPRFSDPGAEPTSWEATVAALRDAELFWITTVRGDGRPHVTPLVAVWHGDALHFCTGPGEQKALNLAANPRVALTTGCSTWDEGLDLVVEGEATRVTDSGTLTALASAWRQKWDGRWHFEAADGGFHHQGGEGLAHVFAVHPTKILAFGKGAFTQTRHLLTH